MAVPRVPAGFLPLLGEASQVQDMLSAPAIAISIPPPPAALAKCPALPFSAPCALVLGANSGSGCFLEPLGSHSSRTKLHQQQPARGGNYWVVTRLLRICLSFCDSSAIQLCSGLLSLTNSTHRYPDPIAHARAGAVSSVRWRCWGTMSW